MFRPRFGIDADTRVATSGSCFPQHVGRALRAAGVNVIDAEPVPYLTSDQVARDHKQLLFSVRHGNFYTAAHLAQSAREAQEGFRPPKPVCTLSERFMDAQRQSLEPLGHVTAEQVIWHRDRQLERVRAAWGRRMCSFSPSG